MRCPHCREEMDDDLMQEGICSECEEEFDDEDLQRKKEEDGDEGNDET